MQPICIYLCTYDNNVLCMFFCVCFTCTDVHTKLSRHYVALIYCIMLERKNSVICYMLYNHLVLFKIKCWCRLVVLVIIVQTVTFLYPPPKPIITKLQGVLIHQDFPVFTSSVFTFSVFILFHLIWESLFCGTKNE